MTKNKKTKTKGKKLPPGQLQNQIIKLLKRHSRKRMTSTQILRKLGVANNKDVIEKMLQQLAKKEQITTVEGNKFQYNKNQQSSSDKKTYTGRVDMTRSGAAYIICDDMEEDVHVSAKYLHTAINGDTVTIRAWRPRGRRKFEGEVTEVTKRNTTQFIGDIFIYDRNAIVTPDGNANIDIIIDLDDTKGANYGEKVIVEVTDWSFDKRKYIKGRVLNVLGAEGSNDIEMKAILINNGFNLEFPAEVMQASTALSTKITKDIIKSRRDMRKVTTFTIDPETARDFDDALSIEYHKEGTFEIGIHIADVAHYVLPDSPLDKEAYRRSTSVYLVDRVLPMLPEKLSNELCSLRPLEDKLTFSAVFTFNKNNKIIDRWFGRTITHSDKRFTYEEAQEVLDTGNGPFLSELKKMNQVAKHLRKNRFKNGSINFETDEVKFRLDEDGVPLDVYIKERKNTHLLVEDFMLLANKEVAIYMFKKGVQTESEIPFVYRIHDVPDPDRVAELVRFAKELGVNLKANNPTEIAAAYNKLADAAAKDPAFKLLQPLAIRTMSKAVYSSNNIGHYGLGFGHYTHFTSPIRRYSDVLSHRILAENIEGTRRGNKSKLEEKCKHISIMERRAMDAERESVKYKQVEFLEKHVGDAFDGVVSGFSDRGIFVQLKSNFCEGRVNFETTAEPFTVAENRLFVTGQRTGKVIKMGDDVKVKISDTDLSRRQISMVFV